MAFSFSMRLPRTSTNSRGCEVMFCFRSAIRRFHVQQCGAYQPLRPSHGVLMSTPFFR